MLERVRSFLAPPIFEIDPEKIRVAGVLHPVLLVMALFFIVNSIVTSLVNPQPAILLAAGTSLAIIIGLLFALRRGYVRQAGILFVAFFFVFFTALVYFLVGVTLFIPIGYLLLITGAGLFVSRRAAVITAVASTMTITLYLAMRLAGNLPVPRVVPDPVVEMIAVAILMVATTIILNLAIRSLETALTEQNRSNRALAESQELLERRVADRTRDLELATEVSRNLAQLRDLDQLLSEAADLIGQHFELYYTQIYLIDAAGRNLVLRAGTGDLGATLVANDHRLPVSAGSINGRAVIEKRAIIVSDTTRSASFRPNPLLPDTRSEMAVPLVTRGRVVGVLDVQSARAGALDQASLPAFEALAGQLAVAIYNAQLFGELAQVQAKTLQQTRGSTLSYWQEYLNAIERSERLGYSYDQGNLTPVSEPLAGAEGEHTLAIPIEVTGQPVGQIRIEGLADEPWSAEDQQFVFAVAQQVAQRIENLRILAEADRYRQEAEEATRRLTRAGWDSYWKTISPEVKGYQYDAQQVEPLVDGLGGNGANEHALTEDLTVRGEAIGQLAVDKDKLDRPEAAAMLSIVAERLGEHIESLRLTEQTQQALSETADQYQASAKLSVAQSYDHVLDVLRKHTVLGKRASNVSMMLFNRAWFDEPPEWADVIAYWSLNPTPVDKLKTRFHIKDYPSVVNFLNPTKPTIIEDVAHAPGLDDRLQQLLTVDFQGQSVIFVPMIVGGEWIGYTNAVYPEKMVFSESDIRQAKATSQQAAVAVQGLRNLQLAEQRAAEAQLHSDELAILNEMGRGLTAILDIEATIDSVFQHTARLMNASDLYVALYYPASNEVDIRIFGEEEEIDRHALRRKAGKGVTEYVITSQQALLLNENPTETLTELGIELIGRLPVSWLGVPMIISRQVIGVIAVQSFSDSRRFDQHDQELLTAVASQAAIALENARLFEQVQSRAKRERILREVSARVRGAVDVDSIMRATVTEVGRALGRQTFVYLGDGQDQPAPEPAEEK